MLNLNIIHWIRIKESTVTKNGIFLLHSDPAIELTPEKAYRDLHYNYPKFFKMDALCKWAWIGAEVLMNKNDGLVYEGIDKNKIAVVLTTSHGCLDVDKKYQQSILSIPSPALFVYTLSNIMLGEICIRHGFKGEQACLLSESFDSDELFFYVNDLLKNRGIEACLCGWIDATGNQHDVSMFWVGKSENGLTFSTAAMQQIHNS